MNINSNDLPNYDIPAEFGLGFNECLVDVTHGLVDFVAGCERTPKVDLNPWYHMLNCGFRIPMIGETDFAAFQARVGAARTYVKLDGRPVGDAGYGAWVEGIKAGRVYFGDGRTHFIDFRANDHAVGVNPLELQESGTVVLTASIACRLGDGTDRPRRTAAAGTTVTLTGISSARGVSDRPRSVPLEIIVNGYVVERREILADGEFRPLSVSIEVTRSSWVAIRVLPSAHTAPIFVSVAGQPVRASRRSAQWSLDCIEALWQKLAMHVRESERADAATAWDHARETYRRILSECASD